MTQERRRAIVRFFSNSFFQQDNDSNYYKKEIQQFIYHESMISVTNITKTVNESTTTKVTTTIKQLEIETLHPSLRLCTRLFFLYVLLTQHIAKSPRQVCSRNFKLSYNLTYTICAIPTEWH